LSSLLGYHGTQETLQANQEQSRLSQLASHDLLISQQVAKGSGCISAMAAISSVLQRQVVGLGAAPRSVAADTRRHQVLRVETDR
jgi:hypothetical protein